MKAPKIGKQTFLRDNPISELSFDKFIKEVYERDENKNPLYTGRYFLILNEENRSVVKATKLLESRFGFSVANTADFVTESLNESKIRDANALFYNDLGIALVDIEEDQIGIFESSHPDCLIEPEKVVYIPDDIPSEKDETSTWGIEITEARYSQY